MNKAQQLLVLLKERGITINDESKAAEIIEWFLDMLELKKHGDMFLTNNPEVGIVIVGSGDTGSSVRNAVELAKLSHKDIIVLSQKVLDLVDQYQRI
jgi:hypothetical protein